MRKFLVYGLWILVALAIIGGGIFAWRTLRGQEEAAPGTAVVLTCNELCAAHGQCGTTMQSPNIPVILAGSNFPVVEPGQHDLFFPNGSQAEVRETIIVTLADVESVPFEHPFARVEFRNPMNDVVTGWVPEWCIEQP